MADQDELRLRIVPELDPKATQQVQDDLNAITGNIPVGGKPAKGGASDPEAALRKQRLADIRAEIDANDLALRKFVSNSQRKQQIIEQEASLGKRSLQETAQLIAQEENLREEQVQSTLQNYDMLQSRLQEFGTYEQDAINRRKQLFFASERAKTGFTSMAGSMVSLQSNTKSANIAFANFGRIVQDAPFGLLGISNNIDPLLNSFGQLKKETGGTGAALAAMGKQLLGPAGLIFLLGSALPTALLFLQKHFQDTKKEADSVTQAVKSLQEQTSKGFAEAAAARGIDELNAGLTLSKTLLAQEEQRLKDIQVEMVNFAFRTSGMTTAERERSRAIREQRTEIEKRVEREKLNVDAFEREIELLKQREDDRARYSQNDIGRAKEEEELSDKRKKDAEDARKEAERLASIEESRLQRRSALDQALSKLFDTELQQRIKDEQASVRELLKNTELEGDEKIRLTEYYNGIEDRLTKEHNARMLAEQRENAAKSLAEKKRAAEQKQKQQEQDDAKELQKEREKQSILAMIEQDKIALMFARGQTIKAIEAEEAAEIARIKAEYDTAEATGLITNAERVAGEKDAIAEAELAAERAKMDARVQMGNMAANAIIGGLSAAFGQSKGIKAAEVAVQSITAAYEAFSSMQAQFAGPIGAALGTAAAAGILAKGRQSIKEIYATKPGSRGASSSGASSSPSAPSGPKFVNDMGAAGQVAGTIGPFGASMTPSISITANLDRQGLALAVRDGESDIATRQIPFAS